MERITKVCALFLLLFLLVGAATLLAQPRADGAPGPQKRLVVGVLHDPPYLIKGEDGKWTGLNVEIWEAISRDLGVDYEFREMTFKEQIDALKSGTIDISIEAFFLLAERQRLFDYSVPYGTTRVALATLPDKISHPWWTAVRIFLSWGTLKTVGVLCAILCFLGFLFWLVEREANPDHFGGGPFSGIAAGVYWVGATLASGVCLGVALKSLPARILGLVWMLVCAVALSALIASLTSSLYESRTRTGLVNDETLRHMRLAGVRESAESIALKNIGGKYVLYRGETDALRALLGRQVEGFLYDEITLRYLKDNDYLGRISVYPTSSHRFMFAFGFPRMSPLRTGVNSALLDLMEAPGWNDMLKRHGVGQTVEQGRADESFKLRL